jgi:hypothetical protein
MTPYHDLVVVGEVVGLVLGHLRLVLDDQHGEAVLNTAAKRRQSDARSTQPLTARHRQCHRAGAHPSV